MNEDKLEWINDQMKRAEVPDEFQEMIRRIIGMYWVYELNNGFDENTGHKILHTMVELVKGHVLVPDEPEGTWVAARPGALTVGDKVRVKPDAFTGETGKFHNGRPGNIVAIRNGDIHVRYTDDREPKSDFTRHSPFSLEKRVG